MARSMALHSVLDTGKNASGTMTAVATTAATAGAGASRVGGEEAGDDGDQHGAEA